MKLSKVLAASSLVFASAGSFATALGSIDLSSGSGFFGNTPIAGAFVDTATFTVTTTSTFTGLVGSVVNGIQDVDFTSIVASGPTSGVTFGSVLSDPIEVWATPAAGFIIAPGVYTLTLTGSNSAAQGSYAGILALTPVPEPETYAMMLAGLGIVGLLSRRRRG